LLESFNKKAIASVNSDGRFESLDRNIIGESSGIQVVKYFIQKYAETDDNVLIVGETGTGKDLAAEAIHRLSKRNDKPYKPVNCAAIPEELIESTLFGVIPKFPGFHNDKPLIGIFEEAHKGTVFLDEIDRMSLRGQSKLLRLLEDRKVIKLGETDKEGKKVDVRIIAAIKPKAIIKIGNEFLEDLYGRLASLFPVIPVLNDRKEDIPQLVEYFVDLIGYNCARVYKGGENGILNEQQYPYNKYKEDYKDKKLFKFDDAGMKLLMDYEWKRNVRELRKFIENIFSVFIENKKIWSDQIVPVDDVKRAFIFHDLKEKISKEEQQLLEGTIKPKTRHINIDTQIPSEIKKGDYPEYHKIADTQKRELIEQFLKLLNLAIENVSKEYTRLKQTVIIEEAIKLNDEEKIFPETISKNAASSITNRFKANAGIIAAILDEKETEYPNISKLKAYKDLVKPIRK
jgi:transcriptional regulator with PAS, ATPase and Fis domain